MIDKFVLGVSALRIPIPKMTENFVGLLNRVEDSPDLEKFVEDLIHLAWTADKFLKRKQTIGQLRQAVKKIKR